VVLPLGPPPQKGEKKKKKKTLVSRPRFRTSVSRPRFEDLDAQTSWINIVD
jgi:hypothetical protein